MPKALPYVSVLLATRNRRALLAKTLDALAAQDWPLDRCEIIVADNGSTDGTETLVREAATQPGIFEIRHLCEPRPGKSHAINAALRVARGGILAFTDDDVRPCTGWLSSLAAAFEDREVDFVVGRIVADWDIPPPQWMSPALYGVLAIPDCGASRLPIGRGVNEWIMPIGANMAMRSAVAHRLGGLRGDLGKLAGTLRTGEDHEYFLRMLHDGCRGVYEPQALVHHWVPRERLNPSYFRRWVFQNGQDVATLEQAYPRRAALLLGIPRYLWRDAATAMLTTLKATLRRCEADQRAALLRIVWIAGYARGRWLAGHAS